MSNARNNQRSFGEKVSFATNRMAHRMGGEFVVNDRWESMVKASSSHSNKASSTKK